MLFCFRKFSKTFYKFSISLAIFSRMVNKCLIINALFPTLAQSTSLYGIYKFVTNVRSYM